MFLILQTNTDKTTTPPEKVMTTPERGLLESLRSVWLIGDEEIEGHDGDHGTLAHFWAADFAAMTLSRQFWASVDEWD